MDHLRVGDSRLYWHIILITILLDTSFLRTGYDYQVEEAMSNVPNNIIRGYAMRKLSSVSLRYLEMFQLLR